MSIYDQARETERKIKNEAANTAKDLIAETNQIKENVTQLMRDTKQVSNERINAAKDYVLARVSDLKTSGSKSLEQTEAYIQQKPAQSVAIAFAAGFIAHLLFGRGRS